MMERYYILKLGFAILFYAAYCVKPLMAKAQRSNHIEEPINRTELVRKPESDLVFYQGQEGTPGVDFPIYSHIPRTAFSCKGVESGYYADLDTDCQVFHICEEEKKISFLCPNGTIFQQADLICEWWFKVNCTDAPNLYAESAEQLRNDVAKRKSLRKHSLTGHETNHGAVMRTEEAQSVSVSRQGRRKPTSSQNPEYIITTKATPAKSKSDTGSNVRRRTRVNNDSNDNIVSSQTIINQIQADTRTVTRTPQISHSKTRRYNDAQTGNYLNNFQDNNRNSNRKTGSDDKFVTDRVQNKEQTLKPYHVQFSSTSPGSDEYQKNNYRGKIKHTTPIYSFDESNDNKIKTQKEYDLQFPTHQLDVSTINNIVSSTQSSKFEHPFKTQNVDASTINNIVSPTQSPKFERHFQTHNIDVTSVNNIVSSTQSTKSTRQYQPQNSEVSTIKNFISSTQNHIDINNLGSTSKTRDIESEEFQTQESSSFIKSSFNTVQDNNSKYSSSNPYPNHRTTYSDLKLPNYSLSKNTNPISSVTPQYITTQSINNGKPFLGSRVGVTIQTSIGTVISHYNSTTPYEFVTKPIQESKVEPFVTKESEQTTEAITNQNNEYTSEQNPSTTSETTPSTPSETTSNSLSNEDEESTESPDVKVVILSENGVPIRATPNPLSITPSFESSGDLSIYNTNDDEDNFSKSGTGKSLAQAATSSHLYVSSTVPSSTYYQRSTSSPTESTTRKINHATIYGSYSRERPVTQATETTEHVIPVNINNHVEKITIHLGKSLHNGDRHHSSFNQAPNKYKKHSERTKVEIISSDDSQSSSKTEENDEGVRISQSLPFTSPRPQSSSFASTQLSISTTGKPSISIIENETTRLRGSSYLPTTSAPPPTNPFESISSSTKDSSSLSSTGNEKRIRISGTKVSSTLSSNLSSVPGISTTEKPSVTSFSVGNDKRVRLLGSVSSSSSKPIPISIGGADSSTSAKPQSSLLDSSFIKASPSSLPTTEETEIKLKTSGSSYLPLAFSNGGKKFSSSVQPPLLNLNAKFKEGDVQSIKSKNPGTGFFVTKNSIQEPITNKYAIRAPGLSSTVYPDIYSRPERTTLRPRPFKKFSYSSSSDINSNVVTPTYNNYKISSARPFKLPENYSSTSFTPAPTQPTIFTTAVPFKQNIDNMMKVLMKITKENDKDYSSETPRPGLVIPPSVGPETLHTLAVYFAHALNGTAGDKEQSQNYEGELDPDTEEKLNNLLTQMTVHGYSQLFRQNDQGGIESTTADIGTTDVNELDTQNSLNIMDTPQFRELAKNFSKALTVYLHDPNMFREDLKEFRPTEPPLLNEEKTEESTSTGDEELLNFSDADSKSSYSPIFTSTSSSTTHPPPPSPTWGYILAPNLENNLDVKNSLNPDLNTADSQSFIAGYNNLNVNGNYVKDKSKQSKGLPEDHWTTSPSATKLWKNTFSINPAVVNNQFGTTPAIGIGDSESTESLEETIPENSPVLDLPKGDIRYDLRYLPKVKLNSTQIHGILIDFMNTSNPDADRLHRILQKLNTTEEDFLKKMKEIEGNPITRRLILLLISECGENAARDISNLGSGETLDTSSSSSGVSSETPPRPAVKENSYIPKLVDPTLSEDDQDIRALQLLNSLYSIASKFGK